MEIHEPFVHKMPTQVAGEVVKETCAHYIQAYTESSVNACTASVLPFRYSIQGALCGRPVVGQVLNHHGPAEYIFE